MEKYIVVSDLIVMKLMLTKGYELLTWTHTMYGPWRFKMRLLQERVK